MEQYLLELIKSNNRVIVPNFGAFIVSRDAGTTVLFNNFLSFNDGLLINHISSRKGIDTTEATQQVSDFVDKIKEELDEKGEYTIEKLGRFTKDQSGILRFTQDPYLAKVLPDSPEEEKPLEKDDDNELLDIDSSDSADKTLPEAKKEEKEKKKIPGSKKESKLLSLEEKKSESSGKPSLPKASTAKKTPLPGSPEARKRVSSSGTYEDKRDGLPPWVIALIILVPVILIILYLFFWHDKDEKDSYTVEEKEIVDTVATQPAVDSIAIQKAEEKERLRKEQEAREKAEAEKTATRRHHIIVGSFEKETNAVNLVKSLKEKGFDQASVFRQNNQYMVTAQSFESLLKARDAQEKILQEHRMENWILTKK